MSDPNLHPVMQEALEPFMGSSQDHAPEPVIGAPSAPTRKVFTGEGDFEATHAAEAWLTANGYSVGRKQRGAPRGIMRGNFSIMKWRNLSPAHIRALDGQLTGDARNGPIIVTLKALGQ